MTETLEELGYSVLAFAQSEAAFEAFRADPDGFDALVADSRMPGMSGSELIRQARRMRPSIPMLLVSGDLSATNAASADRDGPDLVLRKPVSMLDLAGSLARTLAPEHNGRARDTGPDMS